MATEQVAVQFSQLIYRREKRKKGEDNKWDGKKKKKKVYYYSFVHQVRVLVC